MSLPRRLGIVFFGLGICGLAVSCGEKPDPKIKETIPVHGVVFVDGNPTAGVSIKCFDLKGVDTVIPTPQITVLTRDGGEFDLSTYRQGDGLPVGDYAATFFWRQIDMISHQPAGPDKLKDRYSDPKQSKIRFTVEKGKPLELPKIELTTK